MTYGSVGMPLAGRESRGGRVVRGASAPQAPQCMAPAATVAPHAAHRIKSLPSCRKSVSSYTMPEAADAESGIICAASFPRQALPQNARYVILCSKRPTRFRCHAQESGRVDKCELTGATKLPVAL